MTSNVMVGALLCCLASSALLPAQSPTVTPPRLADAPYVAPSTGTREVFTTFENVIGEARGRWRVTYITGQKLEGMRTAVFLPDNPKAPFSLDESNFERLWPLRVGRKVEMIVGREPRRWTWAFEVVDTERIKVRAGEFDTFVVTASEVQKTVVGGDQPLTTIYTFWYAPSIASVVRVRSISTRSGVRSRTGNELVRLERPGKPAIGEAVP